MYSDILYIYCKYMMNLNGSVLLLMAQSCECLPADTSVTNIIPSVLWHC